MQKNTIEPDFLIIPFQLYKNFMLTPLDRMVYAVVYWYEHLKDGICYASNKSIAELLNVDERSVKNSLTRLEETGCIKREFKGENRAHRLQIKTLYSFKRASDLEGKSNDPKKQRENPMTLEGMTDDPQRENPMTRDSNKIINKESIESTPAQEAIKFFESTEMQEKIIDYLTTKGVPKASAITEIKKFVLYWTELNKTGKKQRWELQKTFEVKRRLATWFSNVRQFSGMAEKQGIKIAT